MMPDPTHDPGQARRIGHMTLKRSMIMKNEKTGFSFPKLMAIGFMAGFLSTLIFHQILLGVLWQAGLAPFEPYRMTAVPPFGIPAVFSLAFWGGIWGMLFAWIQGSFPRNAYWRSTFLFGAILPSLVAFLIVLPLKGRPMGGGWHLPLITTAFLINGAWGIGTGIILKLMISWRKQPSDEAGGCAPGAICGR
jgi:undecaprenyl pyrophosphate phosphatase UppP